MNVRPRKRLRFLLNKAIPAASRKLMEESGDVTFLPMEAIGEQGELDTSRVIKFDEASTGYTLFFDGDVVVAKITPCFENGKGALINSTATGLGLGTTELYVLRPGANLDGKYLYYITADPAFRILGETQMTGAAGQKRVPEDFVRDYIVAVPPVSEQRQISRYLDTEIGVIDTLISTKVAWLDLLAEKRRAIVAEAVMRGLNPAAPMRPSGIDWLGDIPAHWEVKKLKYLGVAIIGLTYDPVDIVDSSSGKLVLRASNVKDQKIALDDTVYVRSEIPDHLVTRDRDILICVRSGSRALVGKCAMIDQESAGNTFGAFMTVFRGQFNEFLFYAFNSPLFEYQSSAFSTTTINQLTNETLNNIHVPFPPLEEQHEIVRHIAAEAAKIDRLRAATEHSITLLKERRGALIAAAVTGQIDIPEAA